MLRPNLVRLALLTVAAVCALVIARPFTSGPPVQAAGLTVDTTADIPDETPGDGACAAVGGQCSLRAAVQEANALGGSHTIKLPAGTYTMQIAGTDDVARYGDLDITSNLTIQGAGARTTVIDGNGPVVYDRLFHVFEGATATIDGVTIRNGNTAYYGSSGGAIWNGGTLTLTNSAVLNNLGTQGGAIQNSGTLTLRQVLIADNMATGTGHAGGIYNQGTLTTENVTISGNQAGGVGGGLTNAMSATAALVNDTIVNNSSASGGGIYGQGTISVRNSIIAANTDNGVGPDCAANLQSLGHNFVLNPYGCGDLADSDTTGVDPVLGPLANNGGPTDTHALLAGSPAIDGADHDVCPPVDQRGIARPQGAFCDSGAFEVAGAPVPPLETATPTRTPTATRTPSRTPTRTPTQGAVLPGDANCHGEVDSIDATLVLQYSAGLIGPIACLTTAGDVNGDGRVDSLDAALILQYGAGLIGHLPV